MYTLETKRIWFKTGFAVAAILLPIVLPYAAPQLGIMQGGWISLGRMQVVYAVLSVELALAVYVWGVGNWSRFEPPQPPGSSTTPASGAAQPPKPGPIAPAPNTGSSGQPAGTLPGPQGGR